MLFAWITSGINAQGVAINEDDSSPDASAILDVSSEDKGFLAPRMTTSQRSSIASPATGLILYDTDENAYFQCNGSEWVDYQITTTGTASSDVPTSPRVGDKYYDQTNGVFYTQTTGGRAAISESAVVNSPYGTIDMLFGTASGNSITIDSWNENVPYDGYVILINSENSFTYLSTDEAVYASSSYVGEGEQAIFNGSSSQSISVTLLETSKVFYFKMVSYDDGTGTRVYDNSQSAVFVTTTSCTYTSGTDTSIDEFEARNDDDDYQDYSATVESQVCYSIDFDADLLTISSNQWPDHHMGSNAVSGRFPTAYVVATETVRGIAYKPTYDAAIGLTYVFDKTGLPSPSNPNFYQCGIASNGVDPWLVLDSDGNETG